jgi:nucleotide-binding universal stress UspA family protein
MILICYDGSDDARAAVARAGALLSGEATVLTVWEPFVFITSSAAAGLGYPDYFPDTAEMDSASARLAGERAAEGAELATQAGLDAEGRAVEVDWTIARTVIAEARKLDAEPIVLGSRGLKGIQSALLGSVSHEVLQHAERAVMVVPSQAVADARGAAD